jgi:hypothetical protein
VHTLATTGGTAERANVKRSSKLAATLTAGDHRDGDSWGREHCGSAHSMLADSPAAWRGAARQ